MSLITADDADQEVLNPRAALSLMVDEYEPGPGLGINDMAKAIGKPVATLRKELSKDHRYKVADRTAIAITKECRRVGSPHCNAWLNAVSAQLGVRFTNIAADDVVTSSGSHKPLETGVEMVAAATGALVTVVDARKDEDINDNEMSDIERAGHRVISSTQALMTDCRRQNEAGKRLRAVG